MILNETFRSIQGEGPMQGTPATFIRVQGCNKTCSFCDTVYAQGQMQGEETLPAQLVKEVYREEDPRDHMYVFTGGEPLLQQNAIVQFYKDLWETTRAKPNIWIETNGSIRPSSALASLPLTFVISPKCRQGDLFNNFVGLDFHLKFVLGPDSAWTVQRIQEYIGRFPVNRVWLMPQAVTMTELCERSQEVWKLCMLYGFGFSARLHVWLFGDRRGV